MYGGAARRAGFRSATWTSASAVRTRRAAVGPELPTEDGRMRPCCMEQPVDAVIPVLVVSYDAEVARASQRQHAVEDVDSECHFGCLTLVGLRAQRMTDDPFPAAD